MTIYTFINKNTVKLNTKVINLKFPEGEFLEELPVNKTFMESQYGFSLSNVEVMQFLKHRKAWQNFIETEDSHCMILEDFSDFSQKDFDLKEEVNQLLIEDSDWDIFFPFDPLTNLDNTFELGYLMGFRWGAESYILNRKAAEKLLSIGEIRQPVDEEFIYLSQNNDLNIAYDQTNYFVRIKNAEIDFARTQIKKETILKMNVWTEPNKARVRELLNIISKISKSVNVDLTICYGSLLGYVRHDGIMGWDDDVDLAVNKIDYEKLTEILRKTPNIKHGTFFWGTNKVPYLKIWFSADVAINGYPYSYPFIDIWFYSKDKENVFFEDGKTYDKKQFYPLQTIYFEGTEFKMPQNPLSYLDMTYDNWRTEIQVYTWSHRLEKAHFFPLSTKIKVNKLGQLVDL